MVTKHPKTVFYSFYCLILAKIHMVTKLGAYEASIYDSLILAKIHMVTKPIGI